MAKIKLGAFLGPLSAEWRDGDNLAIGITHPESGLTVTAVIDKEAALSLAAWISESGE